MDMKNKLLSVVAGLAILASTGCATNREPLTDEQRVARVVDVATMAANTGTRLALIEHPEWREDFEAALKGLDWLLEDQNPSVMDLRAVLKKLPVKELESRKGIVMIDTATVLFNTVRRDYVDLDRVKYLKPVIQGIADGMRGALEQIPPMPVPNN